MSRLKATIVAGATAVAALAVTAAPAHAAPQGAVDVGVGFFSVNKGVGCSYSMSVGVNSSGWVSFYDKGRGRNATPIFIGRALADGARAAVTWWPKREGLRTVYAVQHGVKSKPTTYRVVPGYGSGGVCVAFP